MLVLLRGGRAGHRKRVLLGIAAEHGGPKKGIARLIANLEPHTLPGRIFDHAADKGENRFVKVGRDACEFNEAFDRITDRWAFYSNANFQFLGQPDEFRVQNFFSFMVGFDLRLKPRMTAHLQFDHARPFIESELDIFNKGAQQLALGLRWRYSDRFVYEWRFVEDLSDASTDFTVAFQVGIRWDRKSATP